MHGKKGSFLKPRGDVQENDLKLGKKPNVTTWGQELPGTEGLLHTETNGTISKENSPTIQGNYYDFFDGLYHSIVNDQEEPVTSTDGINVMKIIEAAIKSSHTKQVINLQTITI